MQSILPNPKISGVIALNHAYPWIPDQGNGTYCNPIIYADYSDPDVVRVGDWIEFGVSHPCTVFDKWQLIPVLDADDRVVDLVRTYF